VETDQVTTLDTSQAITQIAQSCVANLLEGF
jgi:hypothetical protein